MTFPRNGRRHPRRALLVASLPLVAGAVLAAPAQAVETPNACKFNNDNEFRTQGVEVIAAAPPQAAAGQQFTLSGQKLEVKLRPDLASDAAQVEAIPSSPGGTTSTITTRTWIALRGTNTLEGTRVIGPINVTATTTAYDEGTRIYATPFAYTPPKLPDTTWTATGGDIAFSQAGPGAITAARGQLPVGPGGSAATVQGSAVIQANLPNDVSFYMDCQPGETIVTRPQAGAGTSFNPLVAAPFATVVVAGPPSNPGGTPPARPPGTGTGTGAATTRAASGRIASTKLVAKGSRVALRISCPARGADCAGNVRLRTRTFVKLGSRRPALLNLARTLRYRVVKGKSRTVTLLLSADAKRLLKRRAVTKVRVTLRPASGPSAGRNLNLRRS